MHVVNVLDDGTHQSAFALAVEVGSFDDPLDMRIWRISVNICSSSELNSTPTQQVARATHGFTFRNLSVLSRGTHDCAIRTLGFLLGTLIPRYLRGAVLDCSLASWVRLFD